MASLKELGWTHDDMQDVIDTIIAKHGLKATAELESVYIPELDAMVVVPEEPDELFAWQNAALASDMDDELKEVIRLTTGTLGFTALARAYARMKLSDES